MKYLLLICIVFTGCCVRETARSVKQADQAVEAIGIVASKATPEQMQEAVKVILKLVKSARLNLQPPLALLGAGDEIKVDTTVDEAINETDTFTTKTAMQAGKATIEVESNLTFYKSFEFLTSDNMLALIGTALFGTGSVGLIIAKLLATVRKYKSAVVDAVAYAKDAQAADPEDKTVVEGLKTKHAEKQRIRGTKQIIDEALIRIKTHGPPT